MGGGQGGPPSPGVQIWGAPPWRKKTPSPPTQPGGPPLQKWAFSPSLKDLSLPLIRKSFPVLVVLKKWFLKQFLEKKSRLAPKY